MKFLEKNLEQIIFDSNKKQVQERGLVINGKLLRQLRIGNYGIADLIEHQRPYYHEGMGEMIKGEITVYELKQEKVGVSAFLQALGYVKGIDSYLSKRGINDKYNYNIVLIGSETDKSSSVVYLSDLMGQKVYETKMNHDSVLTFTIYNYEYRLDGIYFKEDYGYSLTNEGF